VTEQMKIATAPGTWGIEPPPQPTDPVWPRILDEIAEAGFDGSELGPLGYYPLDPDELASAFAARELELPAGFVMEPLSAVNAVPALDVARSTCASVAAVQGRCLVLIDGLDPARTATAGRSSLAPRLDEPGWQRLVDTTNAVAAIAREAGLSVAFHPHVGTHVEFEDEIDRLMTDVDPAVGLCVDTGHTVYAGIDLEALIGRYADRIVHMHLKDLDHAVLDRCMSEGLTFEQSVAAQVFTPLGDGSVDLANVATTLRSIGYDGWATFEQDRVLATIDDALQESRRSLAYARSVGF
jgi:inosose dehydratase